MTAPNFDLIVGEIVNLNQIARIYPEDREYNSTEESHETPYVIVIRFINDDPMILCYKNELERNLRWQKLQKDLGVA